MPPVFGHGRLRLYLLKLLDEAPRHGYEVIRLLEERFQGLYAPSAGTVYPRLAKLEAEGLVSHTTEGGRKVYAITAAGREELTARSGELAELEVEIHEALASLASDDSARTGTGTGAGTGRTRGARGEQDVWRQAKEEMRRAKEEWKEQARKAKQEAQQARRQATREREAHTEAVREVQRIARQIQDQVQSQLRTGDWQGAVRDGVSGLADEMGTLGRIAGRTTTWPPPAPTDTTDADTPEPTTEPDATPPSDEPPSDDPLRDLERLLDRFRDDIRDAARDHGIDDAQLRAARHRLAATTTHLTTLLTTPPQSPPEDTPSR